MTSQTEAPDAIGCASAPGAVQRLINADEGEVRIEALLPPNATVLVVTHQRPVSSEMDQRLEATSAGISVSMSIQDHAAARREVNRASDADWATSSVIINGEHHSATVLRLLSGSWAGYAQYKGMKIAFGLSNIDLTDLRLATVNPLDLIDGPHTHL